VQPISQTVQSQSVTLRTPAKINLFLKIVDRRSDGYHEVESLLQKVTLFDVLHLAREGKSVSLSCPGREVPEGPENLAYRAAELFFAGTGIAPGVRIVLEKNIPVAAGLGGGSSDAAAVLLGLQKLLAPALEPEALEDMGLQLGADVPFFLKDYSGAVATGIGATLKKAKAIRGYSILLVNPGFGVSTKWVYENFPLTSCSNPYILARGRIVDSDYTAVPPELFTELGNDLEAVTIKRYPIIGDIKKELKKAGAAAALMSGSGPTVFGLFAGMEEAQRGFVQFAREYGNNVFLVRPYIP
jgi:4-diphosphocytidyl-2-C-methyl-D-erythritol kinase